MFTQSKATAVALLAAAFLAGGAAGWGARSVISRRHCHRRWDANAIAAHLSKKLSLSGAQRDSVRTILQRHRPAIDSIWKQASPRVDSIRSTVHAEIGAQLTAEQQTRYHDLIARFEQRRHAAEAEHR